ncbi:anthrone oxygenase family protein [Kribbella jejuensis]|uniref:anthrone oxygenase family protein n=1 Tax=Kribbella jejuensis TaxID=236068 RepID=UPI001EE37B32|nr:anthrone oxygenase family protein [Kribbella jejuensis]
MSLLFTGLFSGFLLCVLVLETSLRGFDGSVYTQVRVVELDSLDKLAAVTLIPAFVATVVVAVRSRGSARRMVLAAVALLVVVFVTTIVVNLPINSDQLSWSVQQPPSDWASVRDRWQLAHLVRTVAAVVAFGVLLSEQVVGDRVGLVVVEAGRGVGHRQ